MEDLTSSQLQKILEDEATTFNIMQSKISNQIHLLQVEEDLFRQELEKLKREKDYPNQGGVNQIVEVTDEDAAEAGNDVSHPVTGDVDNVIKNVVEVASDGIRPRLTATPEVPEEKSADGVNLIVEIPCDEDEIMRESNMEALEQASTSHTPHLQYQILEPSSDESETDLEDSSHRKERMLSRTSASDSMKEVVGAKRRRSHASQLQRELDSEMEVEEFVAWTITHSLSTHLDLESLPPIIQADLRWQEAAINRGTANRRYERKQHS
ncbi:hypothetical protein R1flu_001011 [Riccia fluitans]|uniref:Uncharacterized protein n=1 Tax=Riccia fluitans TaxID=41844 RepID=A0ABD1Y2E8_9MARC